jgi:hypothetical protein
MMALSVNAIVVIVQHPQLTKNRRGEAVLGAPMVMEEISQQHFRGGRIVPRERDEIDDRWILLD